MFRRDPNDIPTHAKTFYRKKNLLGPKTCLTGVSVHPFQVACLPLANVNLEKEDSLCFEYLKPVMDQTTRGVGVQRETMLRALHFFAQVANTAGKKCDSSGYPKDVRLFCECVVKEWKSPPGTSPQAKLNYSALLPEGVDPFSQTGQEQMMGILDRCDSVDMQLQLHRMMRCNCLEDNNVLGWRLWLISDPECIATRPANALKSAVHTSIAFTDKVNQNPNGKLSHEWGDHTLIDNVQDAYVCCRRCNGMQPNQTPLALDLKPCDLWPKWGAVHYWGDEADAVQREATPFKYIQHTKSGTDTAYHLRFPYPGSVFEIMIPNVFKPASISYTPFPDKYFQEQRRQRLRYRGELDDEPETRNVRPCRSAENAYQMISECPEYAAEFGIQLAENPQERMTQLQEVIRLDGDVEEVEDALQSAHHDGATTAHGLQLQNIDSLKEFVFQPTDDPTSLPIAYAHYAPMTRLLQSLPGIPVEKTLIEINQDRDQPWFDAPPEIDIYYRDKPLSVWGHFIRHVRLYLDRMEQCVSNHTEWILLYIQTLDSFRSEYTDLRLNYLFDGDMNTGKTWIAERTKPYTYGMDIKTTSTTSAFVSGEQECHVTIVFDETPALLQHDRASDTQNHSKIKSFLTNQLVTESRSEWKPSGKNKQTRNALQNITSKNFVAKNLSVMQNMSASLVDPVLASRFCALHVMSVQRPGKSIEDAKRALEDINKDPPDIIENYHHFMKSVAAHTFDVWQFISRGTFKITRYCHEGSEGILSRLFATGKVPIEIKSRFWNKVKLFVKNICVMQAVIAALTLFPDVKPLSANTFAKNEGMKFLETVHRLLYDSTAIVTWAVDVLTTELLDPVHETVRLAMLPLFSDKRIVIEDTGDRKIINANYILTTVKMCEGVGAHRPKGGLNTALVVELAEKIHTSLRNSITRPSLYTLQNSLSWMQTDFMLRVWKTDTTLEEAREEDGRVNAMITESRERQPLLKHFKGLGWAVHRDIATLPLSLFGGISDKYDDYAEALQLHLTEPRYIVRGFSQYQYAQMAGKSMADKTEDEISDSFMDPEITEFAPCREQHVYKNAAYMSSASMTMLNMSSQDRSRMRAKEKTVSINGDMDRKSFEAHMTRLNVPRDEWVRYDMTKLVTQHMDRRGY